MIETSWAKLRPLISGVDPLISRGITLSAAYLTTMVVVLTSLQVLAVAVPPNAATAVLSYYLICGTVSGIDPGSAKAAMIARATDEPLASEPLASDGLIAATVVKAVAMSPMFAAVWLYTSPAGFGLGEILVWTPLLMIIGFVTTNYRNLLDYEGRYTSAIWLKQGSLSIAAAVTVIALVLGATLTLALALATGLRILWLVPFARGLVTPATEHGAGSTGPRIRRWLTTSGWVPIAVLSVLASLGGSIDRMVVLRYLGETAGADYFMLYEVLSKFWLFPYILSPILFAKRVRGGAKHALGQSVVLLCVLGAAFLAATWIVFSDWFAPSLRLSFAIDAKVAMIVAAAFAIAAVSQLLTADLQARDGSRALVAVSLFLLPLTYFAFTELTQRFRLEGVALAWLARTGVELLLIIFLFRSARWK